MAARIHELKHARMEARRTFQALMDAHLEAATAGNRYFTDDEKRLQSLAEAKITKLDEEILAEEERIAGEKARVSGASRPTGGAVGRRFAETFGSPRSLADEGWQKPGEYFATLAAGVHHPALRAAAGVMREAIGSDGGFLVPEEIVAEAFDGALEDEPILRMVQVEPMTSETKRVAGFATKDHSTAGPFGFSGGWIAEGQTMTAEKALVRSIQLQAKKLGLLVQASNEVASDGLGFDAQLQAAMRAALGWLLADAVFNGSGAGQPLGLRNSPCKVTVAKETGQTAASIVYANITAMLSRILPSSAGRAAWFASHTTRPELMKLAVPIGVGGSFVPLTVEGGVYRLLGLPLYWTEHLPVLGSEGDLVLTDPSQYVLGLRKQVTLDKSAHVGFASDLMTYRGIVRADGQAKHDAAFQPKNGSTMSPFVTLAARA